MKGLRTETLNEMKDFIYARSSNANNFFWSNFSFLQNINKETFVQQSMLKVV